MEVARFCSASRVVIVAGKGGVILPQDEAEIRRLAPAIEIRKVERAGHQMQVDDCDGFLDALRSVTGMAG